MFRLFKDPAHQRSFETDGFVKLPLLGPAEVERLRAIYAGATDGRRVRNASYGLYVSIDDDDAAQRRGTIDSIREVVMPHADRFVHRCKSHLGSFLVKVPDPAAYTYPHQDWTFVDNEYMDELFSITVWIALGDYGRDEGSLGFVKGSHRFFGNINCSPSPATRTPTQGLEPLLFNYLSFPEMRAGDALAFNNKTIHAALPNRGDEQRIAVGIGLTPLEARMHHYFLKPGTQDTLLKLEVEEDFFLHYDNDRLQALWEAGEYPDHCRVVGELPHHLGTVSAADLEALCLRHGSVRNDVVFQPPGVAGGADADAAH